MHRAAGATRLGRLALQQMRADALELVAQHAAGARHRAARHDHAARGEGAEAERGALGVAVPHRDIAPGRCRAPRRRSATASSRAPGRATGCRPSARGCRPVRMRAVQLSKPGMTEAPREANSAAPCAVCSVKLAKPMPISRPSGFAALLPGADLLGVQQLGAEPDAGRIVAGVVAHAGDRGVGHLVGAGSCWRCAPRPGRGRPRARPRRSCARSRSRRRGGRPRDRGRAAPCWSRRS